MLKPICLGAIVPATLILTLSYFVLLSLRKAESSPLKPFGYVVAALLWISALLVFAGGMYTLSAGRFPRHMMMHKRPMICKGMMAPEMMDKHMMEKKMMEKGEVPKIKR